VTAATLGNGDGGLDQEMAKIPGIEGWSTFGFTQLPIGGQEIPVLGLATHEGRVEPPTVDGQRLSRTQALTIGTSPRLLSDQIELGAVTLQQLGKSVGNSVRVGTGPNARTLKIVGTVTLPSIGVQLSDHVSLGRGAMLSESTLLEVLGLSGIRSAPEAVSALPSTVAIDLKPAASAQQVVERLRNWATTQGGQGDLYQVPRVLGAQIVNAGQMGSQPVVLAIALAVGVLLSLTTTILAAAWRRRRELAVLKALGLTRRQLRIIVTVQTLILLLIAVVVGIPVGIAAGHLLWDNFAASLGVVPVVVVPLAALVVGVIALLLVGTALATIPALVAARTPTAVVLRAE
jgi:ABC-type antimicrobial peptide transport system permease subunit